MLCMYCTDFFSVKSLVSFNIHLDEVDTIQHSYQSVTYSGFSLILTLLHKTPNSIQIKTQHPKIKPHHSLTVMKKKHVLFRGLCMNLDFLFWTSK